MITMSTRKQPEVVRRVWRMTAEAPAGEYLDLELVPKDAPGKSASEAAPRRTLHPETPPAYRKVSAADISPQAHGTHMAAPTEGPTTTVRQSTPPPELPSVDLPIPPVARARVLKPAQVESWQSSSFDLLTGCIVRDVTDTIPGNVYDELFGPREEHPISHGSRRRR